MSKMTFILSFFLYSLFCAPLFGQHLPPTPNFCAGNLCIEALPVVSDGHIEYPSFRFVQSRALKISTYEISYETIGYLRLVMSVGLEKKCGKGIRDKSMNIGSGEKHAQMVCGSMLNGDPYRIEIHFYGLDSSKGHEMCMQALGSIWQFDPMMMVRIGSGLIDRKIPLSSNCSDK